MKKKRKLKKKKVAKNPRKIVTRADGSERPVRPKPGFKRERSQGSGKQNKFEHTVFTKVWEGRNWRLIVGVHSYKGGKPKLIITREHASRKYLNAPFAKLGRLSKEELEGLMPILTEALTHMR